MSDPLFELARETETALDYLGTPRRDAGRTLAWAAFNLRAAQIGERIVTELGTGIDGYRRLQATLEQDWDVLEVAAMSLGFEDVTTALDLCSHAAFLATGGVPSADGKFKGLAILTTAPVETWPIATRAWAHELASHRDLQVLRQCRDGLAHRLVTRHIRIGGGVARSLAEISTPPVLGGNDGVVLGNIGELIPRLLRFGEIQFVNCCAALRGDFGR